MNFSKSTIAHLPLDQIVANPQQPRRTFKEQSLRGLAQSIRTQGIIQPLIVRRAKNSTADYELIAGERRWRALHYTDITNVPVIITEIADQNLLEVALLENIQREDLTSIEEGQCYRELLQAHGYTQEQLARRIGKDRSTIANLIRLLALPLSIQKDIEEKRLSMGHARALLSLSTSQEMLEVRETLLKNNWSVRKTEQIVKSRTQSSSSPQHSSKTLPSQELALHLQSLELELQREYGTKVSIQAQNNQGKLIIDYSSLEEFERIYEKLMKSKIS